MKKASLFSWKDKSEKLKCHLLQSLFGTLRVNGHSHCVNFGKDKEDCSTGPPVLASAAGPALY